MISVLMTTYNCAKYIRTAVQSILNQTFKNFECLIIDDGSTDNTQEMIKSFNDDRIISIQSKHIGRSAVLNLGLKEANYDLVSFCDADDIIHPQKVAKQIKLMSGENDLIFTGTAFFKNKKILYEIKNQNNINIIKRKVALHGHLGPSVLFNRKFILDKGGFNNDLNAFEDYDLWLRILNRSNIVMVPERLYYQRLRKNSLSTTETMKKKRLIYEIQQPYYDRLSEHFGITSSKERLILKGWREFFYGSKNLARNYWLNAGLNKWNLKLGFSLFLSFLPEKFLDYLKDKRIRLRFEYQLGRLLSGDKIQREFKEILRMIGE